MAPERQRRQMPEVKPAAAELQRFASNMEIDKTIASEQLVASLPEDWIACQAPSGEVYYHDLVTGASQWTHPELPWDKWQPKQPEEHGEDFKAPGRLPRRLLMHRYRQKTSEKEPEEKPPAQRSVYDAQSRHVPLRAPETLFSHTATKVLREDFQEKAFALHGLLSADEASGYATAAEASGFKESDVNQEFPAEMRNNSRLIHFSDALASALWYRLKPLLMHKDIYLMQPMGFCAEGRWKPVSVNPCFRISRYQAGEHFTAHRDGMYVNEDGESSIYSLVLYLNDNFEGGELKLLGQADAAPYVFKPRAGSAVLFPHDLLHEAGAVKAGTKYVARTEIMFRCVNATPLPPKPRVVDDPLFQRMAALYEQIGDLVQLGDALETTAAYQEALGIQIAYKGTSAAATASALPLPDGLVARCLSFLEPRVITAAGPVHSEWNMATKLGLLWRDFYQRRWPLACPLMEDRARHLDPELKDWLTLFRQAQRTEDHGALGTVFLSEFIHAQLAGEAPVEAVKATAAHHPVGIGWDSSFRQRAGWSVGDGRSWRKMESWLQGREINWHILATLFGWALKQFDTEPWKMRLLIPALPGVWTKSTRARATRILTGRFEIPGVYIVPAPFCALLAHGLTTGTVVWISALGQSAVCCYEDGVEVLSTPFNASTVSPENLAMLIFKAAESLGTLGGACDLLSTITFSFRQASEESKKGSKKDKGKFGYVMAEAATFMQGLLTPKQRISDAVKFFLQGLLIEDSEHRISEQHRRSLEAARFLESASQHNDVMMGASILAASPDRLQQYEVKPEERASWEWRWFVKGCWLKLPAYAAGVFEEAFRNDAQMASAELETSTLIADLQNFVVSKSGDQPYKLTRFLRGKPSATPDLRKPEDLERVADAESEVIEQVPDADAVHVRTMAGRIVFSASKAAAKSLTLQDIREEVACNMGTSFRRLQLLGGSEAELQAEGALELLVVLGEEAASDEERDCSDEQMPEDWPGEFEGYE